MPAAAIRCKQPKPTPMRRPLAAGIILAAATRAQQPPSSHTPASTAMPHHRRKPSMNNDDTGNATGRVGSQQTTPKAPPLLVQGGQGFHPENPRNRNGLQDDAPNGENDALGRRRHHRQQECRQGFRPENPIHSTHSARRSEAAAMEALPGAAPPQCPSHSHQTATHPRARGHATEATDPPTHSHSDPNPAASLTPARGPRG